MGLLCSRKRISTNTSASNHDNLSSRCVYQISRQTESNVTRVERKGQSAWPFSKKILPFKPEFPLRSSHKLKEFEVLNIIACGSYGSVVRAVSKFTKKQYAIKIIAKEKLLKEGDGAIRQSKDEVNILSKLRHPFINKFYLRWQTRNQLILVMEYLPGGELFNVWKLIRTFSSNLLRFYIVQVALALDYLHSCHVLYRDLKMENLLLDSSGYVKIIDFGLSKQLAPGDRTWTICGTLPYTAPETLNGLGYNFLADWWSLGILCYVLACGVYPVQPGKDHVDMRCKVNESRYDCPSSIATDLSDVLHKLLQKEPNARIFGCHNLRLLAFFDGIIDFEKVARRQYDPRAFFMPSDIKTLRASPLKHWILSTSAASGLNVTSADVCWSTPVRLDSTNCPPKTRTVMRPRLPRSRKLVLPLNENSSTDVNPINLHTLEQNVQSEHPFKNLTNMPEFCIIPAPIRIEDSYVQVQEVLNEEDPSQYHSSNVDSNKEISTTSSEDTFSCDKPVLSQPESVTGTTNGLIPLHQQRQPTLHDRMEVSLENLCVYLSEVEV